MLLGHRTLQMSMRYSHLAKEHLKSAISEVMERWDIYLSSCWNYAPPFKTPGGSKRASPFLDCDSSSDF